MYRYCSRIWRSKQRMKHIKRSTLTRSSLSSDMLYTQSLCALLYGYFRHFHGLISTIRDFALGGTQNLISSKRLNPTKPIPSRIWEPLVTCSPILVLRTRPGRHFSFWPSILPILHWTRNWGPPVQRTGVPTHSFSPSPLLPSHQNAWLGYLKRRADY